MLLALSVISSQGSGMGATAYKVFDERGGSVGRLDSNDWALPDPDKFVSSRHATLKSSGGTFYLEDVSTNGTFINALDHPVSRSEPTPLQDGDRIFIGDYEILVQVIDDGVPAMPAIEPTAVPLSRLLAPQPQPQSKAPPQPLSAVHAPAFASDEDLGTVDPLAVIGADAASSSAPRGAVAAWDATSLRPRAGATVGGAAAVPAAPVPPPPVAAQPLPPLPAIANQTAGQVAALPVTSDGTMDLLTALGLEPSRVDPSIFQQLGLIVRTVVQGMIEVLQARAEVKNNFRMPMTSIRPVENNPLKFSLNADDALHNLFVKRNPGYLGPIDSFQESFQDISFHQVAMLAGIRAAYNAMLEKFKPEHLEAIYERKLRRTSMIAFGHRSKFWELYREQFEDIEKDMEANFQLLFGEEFAKAYNDQLNKLAAAARSRHR